MANIATIAVSVRANVNKFVKGLKRAKKTFDRFVRAIKKSKTLFLGLASVITGALAGGALTLLIKRSAQAIDRMGKLGKTLGIATKDIALFRLASDLGGSSLENFAKASRQVAKNVFDFVVRGTGEASDAFKQLNISTRELRTIQNDQVAVMQLIANRFAGMEDGAIKTAVAYKLLGGRATELLPAIESLAKGGFERLRKITELAGTALSESMVKRVEAMNDSFRITREFLGGIIDQLTSSLAPALLTINNAFQDWLITLIQSRGGVMNLASEIATTLVNSFVSGLKAIGGFANGVIRAFNVIISGAELIRNAFLDIQHAIAQVIEFFGGPAAGRRENFVNFKRLEEFDTTKLDAAADKVQKLFEFAKKANAEADKVERAATRAAERPLQKEIAATKARIAAIDARTADSKNLRREIKGEVILAKINQAIEKLDPKSAKQLEQLKTLEAMSATLEEQLTAIKELNFEAAQARAA